MAKTNARTQDTIAKNTPKATTDSADLVVVLPDFSTPDAELSAQELEAVAGGTALGGCTVCGDDGRTVTECAKTCDGMTI